MAKKRKVLLVDDHPIVLFGLSTLLQMSDRYEVCWEARTARQAQELSAAQQPDDIILDLVLGGRDDLELLKELRATARKARILIFSAQPEMAYALRAFQAGADGYLMKDEGIEKVPGVLEILAGGERFASDAVQRAIFQKMSGFGNATPGTLESLSDRELQVFRLLGAGKGTAQIAAELRLSMKTVGTYRERLKNKLGAADAHELSRRACDFIRSGNV